MKRVNVLLILAISVGFLISLGTNEKAGAKTIDLKLAARNFVETLVREDFSDAVKSFGTPLSSSLPAERLRETWKSVLTERGSFKEIVGIQSSRAEEYRGQRYDVVVVKCQFERAKMDVRISFNNATQITSLWFVPPEKK